MVGAGKGRGEMPNYMIQIAYTSNAWATQIKDPKNRLDAIRPVIEGLGGSIVDAWLSFGEYDVVLVVEMPDNTSVAALSIAISAGGATKAAITTPLMTIEEGVEAMRKAAGSGYRPPGT